MLTVFRTAVEYRLLPTPFPAALQDAVTVYASLLRKGIPANRIVIIGDSAGGNVALALARWIRDENVLDMPGAMVLLSVCSPVLWRCDRRLNPAFLQPWCDPGTRLLQKLNFVSSLFSLISNSRLPSFAGHSFPESVTSYIPRPNPEDYLADDPTARILLVSSLLGHHDRTFVNNPYISPASQLGPHGSFHNFPPTFVHYGDAERLQQEIENLVRGMKRDDVPVEVEKTVDGVHDLLMMRFWNEDIRADIYRRIKDWLDQSGCRAVVEAQKKEVACM